MCVKLTTVNKRGRGCSARRAEGSMCLRPWPAFAQSAQSLTNKSYTIKWYVYALPFYCIYATNDRFAVRNLKMSVKLAPETKLAKP